MYTTDDEYHTFYQICTFLNPLTNKRKIRRFVFDSGGNIRKVHEKDFDENTYNKIAKQLKENQYKFYNVYDLDNVEYPCYAELMIAQSPILNVDSDKYTQYAAF
jgi:hypothetical protein